MPPDGSFEFPTSSTRDVTPAERAEFHASAPIYVDRESRQVLALDGYADVFFGLLPGTNGTGPAMRRACVPGDFTWLASDCRRARGVLLVPSNRSDELQTNPWSGKL